MKKINLLFLLTFFLLCTTKAQSFAGGAGTQSEPYLIGSKQDLLSLNSAYSSANPSSPELVYFKMIADVDLTGETWAPFNATSSYNKHVHFDGNGHVIKNLTATGTYAGLFGVLCGVVKNLGVINATISGSSYHGVIAGYLGLQSPTSPAYTGIIENCYTSGTIITTGIRAGGIAGYIGGKSGSTVNIIRNCYSTVNIASTTTTLGGIAGAAMNAFIIENCYSTGKLRTTGGGYVAGILAQQRNIDTASELKGCVVRNDSLIADNATAIKLGRISGEILAGTVVGNSLGSAKTIVKLTSAPTYLTDFNESGIVGSRYDGVTTSETALSQQATYASIGWSFTSTWSPKFHNVYPIHQWLAARADYKQISGFASSSDASLVELQFKGSAINNFSAETSNYDIVLPLGATAPAVEDFVAATTHANAVVNVTRNTATFPVTVTVAVTAEDEITTKNYIINFTEDISSKLQNTRIQNNIVSNDGSLIISDVQNKSIGVYSLAGQLIFSTNATSDRVTVPLSKGVYLVRIDDSMSKVIIK